MGPVSMVIGLVVMGLAAYVVWSIIPLKTPIFRDDEIPQSASRERDIANMNWARKFRPWNSVMGPVIMLANFVVAGWVVAEIVNAAPPYLTAGHGYTVTIVLLLSIIAMTPFCMERLHVAEIEDRIAAYRKIEKHQAEFRSFADRLRNKADATRRYLN